MNDEKAEEKPADSVVMRDEQQIEKPAKKDVELKKQTVAKQNLDLQLDLEKSKKDDAGLDKMHKQQAKDPKVGSKQEKSGDASSKKFAHSCLILAGCLTKDASSFSGFWDQYPRYICH